MSIGHSGQFADSSPAHASKGIADQRLAYRRSAPSVNPGTTGQQFTDALEIDRVYFWTRRGYLFQTMPGESRKPCLPLVVILSAWCASAGAATFTVTSVAESGPGTLRQAIMDANIISGLNYIYFNISPPGIHVITPTTMELPEITNPVVIDGRTQPGYATPA